MNGPKIGGAAAFRPAATVRYLAVCCLSPRAASGRSLPVASSAGIGQCLMQTVVSTHAIGWSMETNTNGHAGCNFANRILGGPHSLEPDVSITEIHTHRQTWVSG